MKRFRKAVYTPSSSKAYTKAVSLLVYSLASTLPGHKSGEVNFAEIGGGDGSFKHALLLHASDNKKLGGKKINYLSIEPNQMRLHSGHSGQGHLVHGTAQQTNLKDESVDVLFDDEVINCLPFRAFILKSRSKSIELEAFVKLKNEKLALSYESAEKDEQADFFEKYLASFRTGEPLASFRMGKNKVHGFSSHYQTYWEESMRVLKKGGLRVSFDYSTRFPLQFHLDSRSCEALKFPYQVDLTHLVDFNLQEKMCINQGFQDAKCVYLYDAIYGALNKKIQAAEFRFMLFAIKPLKASA